MGESVSLPFKCNFLGILAVVSPFPSYPFNGKFILWCFFLQVGYKVRLEGMKGRDTHLLFCTTGILLRRLLIDRNLKGVTHVIVDEIHERGMNEGKIWS